MEFRQTFRIDQVYAILVVIAAIGITLASLIRWVTYRSAPWAGADLVSDWFRRNMRIYSNIIDLADSPNERVLVIYGYGHTGWLQHNFASDPTIRLRKLTEFAK